MTLKAVRVCFQFLSFVSNTPSLGVLVGYNHSPSSSPGNHPATWSRKSRVCSLSGGITRTRRTLQRFSGATGYKRRVFFFHENCNKTTDTTTQFPSQLRWPLGYRNSEAVQLVARKGLDMKRSWLGAAARRLQDNGLCKDVFQQHHMMQLRGRMGLAHCRYPTAGGAGLSVRVDGVPS